MPLISLTIWFQGQQKSLTVEQSATVVQVLRKFREEYHISRFSWLEFRADNHILRGSRNVCQNYIQAPRYEIICVKAWNCI
jgi:hypothetical protein